MSYTYDKEMNKKNCGKELNRALGVVYGARIGVCILQMLRDCTCNSVYVSHLKS